MKSVLLSVTQCFFVTLLIVFKVESQGASPLLTVKVERANHSISFQAEPARTAQELSQGLMGRSFLNENQAMLFIFPQTQYVKFWMKNTLISLDLIFADATGKVIQLVEHAQPQDLTPIFSHQPTKYVLEVSSGSVHTFDIRYGDFLIF